MTQTQACPWPLAYTTACDSMKNLNPDAAALIEQAATDLLWNWTNRLFGVCPVKVRPCLSSCAENWMTTFWGNGPYPWHGAAHSGGSWVPVLLGGSWYNVGCGCIGVCTCALDGARTIALPGPVESVERVLIDGAVVPATSYRLDYHRYLLRTDGETWPACQDLMLADDAVGAFVVEYNKGIPVPVGGQIAAGKLACEMAKGACGDETCELPERLQTITRQGVTVGFMDQFEQLAEGRSGIYSVDAWLTSVNMPRPFAGVRSVDVPQQVNAYPMPR